LAREFSDRGSRFRLQKNARKQDEKNEIELPGASEAADFQLPCY
jgi:hypothetical protein